MTEAALPLPGRAPPLAQSFVRRSVISLFILGLLSLLSIPFFASPVDRRAPEVSDGRVSYGGRSLTGPVELGGTWLLEWRSPLAGRDAPIPPFPARVPGIWAGTDVPGGGVLPAQGRIRYTATLSGLTPGSYRIYVPTAFAAAEVRVEGRLVSKRGILGTGATDTVYFMRAQDFAFEAGGGDIRIDIDLATFLHRVNGIEAPPILGTATAMQGWIALRWAQEMLFQVSLMLLGAFSLALFLFRRTDRASLFAAIACFAFMPSSLFTGFDNMLLVLFPALDLRTMLAIIDLCGTAAVLSVLTYVHTLFPQEGWRRVYLALAAAVAIFWMAQAALYTFAPVLTVSRFNVNGLYVQLAAFLYIIVVLVRAAWRQREGAIPFLIGMGMFFGSILMLTVVAYGLVPSDRIAAINYTAFGVLIMLFSHLVVIAERWSQTIVASETMTEELRQLLDVNASIASEIELGTLLRRIVEVNSRILHAERSSLFLYDPERKDLWTLVAEGVAEKEIRISADTGLAGAAFTGGETIIVADPYSDGRFNPAIDAQTGFVTRSIIAMPVVARDGRRIGVMQALNAESRNGFSEADAVRMSAFAGQAAVAIDNATLFSEVVESRNYNESILGSMSSGVVTLDPSGRVAKLNAAAIRIFRTTEAALRGSDVYAVLERTNPWLIAELEAVRETGETRNLLDADLVTGDGSHIAANLTVVPLRGEIGDAGILLIVEDISEGKRMEGAMRRFMPQQVVKEVLGRGDDLLFGSSVPASVLFADIRSFTSIAEALSARETVDMLNEIFTDLFEAVASTDGMIDKYMGDAVMAVYGAPLPGGQDAINAVSGAIQMIAMIEALNVRRRKRGEQDLRLGAGIASGEVVAGTIGSPKRMDYTVIGDTVNLAARLQDATKTYRVNAIVCEATAAKAGTAHRFRALDLIRVRGRQTPTGIYEILATGSVSADLCAAYAEGRAAIDARNWSAAIAAFQSATQLDPDDRASAIMLERVQRAQATPPPPDWDGVW